MFGQHIEHHSLKGNLPALHGHKGMHNTLNFKQERSIFLNLTVYMESCFQHY